MSTVDKLIDLYPSSLSCICRWCKGVASYHGRPEVINAAAREFYKIHEVCRYGREEAGRKEQVNEPTNSL